VIIMTATAYTVAGMTCGHCVGSVTEEVGAVPGVTGGDHPRPCRHGTHAAARGQPGQVRLARRAHALTHTRDARKER
jgi:hypothetical protein